MRVARRRLRRLQFNIFQQFIYTVLSKISLECSLFQQRLWLIRTNDLNLLPAMCRSLHRMIIFFSYFSDMQDSAQIWLQRFQSLKQNLEIKCFKADIRFWKILFFLNYSSNGLLISFLSLSKFWIGLLGWINGNFYREPEFVTASIKKWMHLI